MPASRPSLTQLTLLARPTPPDGCGTPTRGASLLLVGCVRTKIDSDDRVPVRDLYTSVLWGLRRRYAEARARVDGVAWGVVSAGLGVVAPHRRARRYEATANGLTGAGRMAWLAQARQAISRRLWPVRPPSPKVIEVLAGAAYVTLLREALAGLPVCVVNPVRGYGIGRRQGWMKRQASAILERAEAVEAPAPELPPRHTQLPLFAQPALYFASGSNHAGEIQGFAQIGTHVGVAVDELNVDSIWALKQLAGTCLSAFVDSGAFSEVAFGADGPRVAKPISHADWLTRLDVMLSLARALGSQVYVVAPDMVGHRAETLARLRRYAPQVRQIRAYGARVIVPIQKGDVSMAAFDNAASEALGFDDYVRGAPMRRGVTTVDDLRDFLANRRIAALHLLGLGPKSADFPAVERMLRTVAPCTAISMDSGLRRSAVGRRNGPGGGPRILTAAEDVVRASAANCTWGGDCGLPDYTDEIASPSGWASPTALRRIAKSAELSRSESRAFRADPDGYLADRGVTWNIEAPLDEAWQRWFLRTGTVEAVKRRAVVRAFARETSITR